MTRRHRLTIQLALLATTLLPLVSPCALAQQRPTPPDLPPTELARESIDQDPAVVAARRALDAASHGAAALRAGSHEWITRLAAQRRRYDVGGNSNEWTASLERTIRIGGKAEIDAGLGDIEQLIGQARIGEARHEAARALVDLWLDAFATRRQRELWDEQLRFAQASYQAVEKRHKAGDASVLDLNVARADLIEVQRQLSTANTAQAKTKAKLAIRFPTLKDEPQSPAKPAEPTEPTALDMSLPQWRDRILAESDSMKIAQGLLKKAELSAARAKADRIPDPTVGVYTASEAFRNERVIGLSVSIPLSGRYRDERMQQALQEAEAARANVQRHQREVEAEVVEAYADASGGLERWRVASQGLAITRDSARLTQRAYSLGEADLQTLLLARRQALDATTATEQARVEALRWHYRLLVDAHLIWALEED